MTENATDTEAALPARRSLDAWLTMWNSDSTIARKICSEDFRIHFGSTETDGSSPGDAVRTAEDFEHFLEQWRHLHPGVVFTPVADAIDADRGRLLWDVEMEGQLAGGVDVFDIAEDGRIRRVWSIGGQRSMRS